MLRELIVEDLGVIDRAELTLEPGTTALTGETGAGKTLLVAGLSLLLGGRADRALVRAGAERALVEGRFEVDPGHPVVAKLAELGLVEPGDGPIEVIVGRTVRADGGGKARVNGRIATISQLGEIGRSLVEIAGQNEYHRLGTGSFQRGALDAFGGTTELAGEVRDLVRAASDARRRLDELRTDEGARERAVDMLRYEIGEIEAAGITAGEWERLRSDAAKYEHAETIATAVGSAIEGLRADDGAEERLTGATGELTHAAGFDPSLNELSLRLERAAVEVADISSELAARAISPDPERLEETRERLAILNRMQKKYGDGAAGDRTEAVISYLENARAQLEKLANITTSLDELSELAEQQSARAHAAAAELSTLRADAAPKLERALIERLKDLAIPDASVRVVLEERELYEGGLETVTFLAALSAASGERPLGKVASGGELSRVALALHVLTADSSIPTMVFDEVDAGVGGKAAQSVGRSLAELARTGTQVFLVTHLPQVAAFADSHFRVSKKTGTGRARVQVDPVAGEDRIGELSRMLAGLESERAREHARELLEMASAT